MEATQGHSKVCMYVCMYGGGKRVGLDGIGLGWIWDM